VPRRDLVAIVDSVESMLADREVREMSTQEIGNAVTDQLRRLDQVAYVRFASVYRRFEDVNQFMDELKALILHRDDERG
jgi:transcriptional repressor NrdR